MKLKQVHEQCPLLTCPSCLSDWSLNQNGPLWPLNGWNIFDVSFATIEQILGIPYRKHELKVLYKVCFFRPMHLWRRCHMRTVLDFISFPQQTLRRQNNVKSGIIHIASHAVYVDVNTESKLACFSSALIKIFYQKHWFMPRLIFPSGSMNVCRATVVGTILTTHRSKINIEYY